MLSLSHTEKVHEELRQVTEERDNIQRQKEEEVASLHEKLRLTEKSYETILYEALDSLAAKMEGTRAQWNAESALIEHRAQQVMLEFNCGHIES